MKFKLTIFITTIALLFFPGINTSAQDISSGEGTFKQVCASCHGIGRGRLVGPDLINVQQRISQDWFLKFVKSSQSVIKSGDKYADSLFRAYNQVVMPDQPTLSDDQIKNIIAYIESKSAAPVTGNPVTTPDQTSLTTNNNSGKLFTTANIFLFGIILFMLIVIWSLSRINKNLLDQIKDYYSSDRSYF
jgi:mono/diheme cytochrome c family protein